MLTVDFDRLGLVAGERALDMGCGAGRHAFEMYRRGADVVAFDQDADELAAVSDLFAAMRQAGVPAAVSNTAGTYVCNHIMYQVLYMIDHEFPGKRSGFIHVPYIPQQVVDKPGEASLSIADMATALEAGVGAIVEYADKPDERTVGGAIH